MSRNHYFYFQLNLDELEAIVETHQKSFDEVVGDLFSEEELIQFDSLLDSIAPISVQPMLEELRFEDFSTHPAKESEQRAFFESCQSSVCIENLPYFEEHPFQVSYLIHLLQRLPDFLVDMGGLTELQSKHDYLHELSRFKEMEALLQDFTPKPRVKKSSLPVDPIDFLVLDVYKELDRLGERADVEGQSDKLRWLYFAMKAEKLDPTELLKKCGLSAKDFDDYLEKLKFHLRKQV